MKLSLTPHTTGIDVFTMYPKLRGKTKKGVGKLFTECSTRRHLTNISANTTLSSVEPGGVGEHVTVCFGRVLWHKKADHWRPWTNSHQIFAKCLSTTLGKQWTTRWLHASTHMSSRHNCLSSAIFSLGKQNFKCQQRRAGKWFDECRGSVTENGLLSVEGCVATILTGPMSF